MKKLTLIVAALSVLSLASCKKAYDCTCKTTETSTTYKAVMTQYNTTVNLLNDAVAADVTISSDESVVSMDKTSKANANSACASSVSTNYYETADYNDLDNDNNEKEVAFSETSVYTTACALAKK